MTSGLVSLDLCPVVRAPEVKKDEIVHELGGVEWSRKDQTSIEYYRSTDHLRNACVRLQPN